ncbi:MAG: SWIM zinc finger family protein, partial [Candidatus Obscuribacterales bacterium]|nr:SWIM zinc finger family protein [Candidatus Obscuribacterales bacterium]
MGWGYEYRPYVSVAERRKTATQKMGKLRKQGINVEAIEIEGRNIATTFWGKSWCSHLESFSDYSNRLPRGRTYVRNGSVCHLEIKAGEVKAIVSGSELYDVTIKIKQLPQTQWTSVKEQCSGKIGSILELLQGRLSDSVMKLVTDKRDGLFPKPSEIKLDCSCPDWASMCKHLAAVLYGVGARFDKNPELLFLLRGVDHKELIDADSFAAVSAMSSNRRGRRIAESDLENVFGIEILPEEKETKDGKEGKESKKGKEGKSVKTKDANANSKTNILPSKTSNPSKSERESRLEKKAAPLTHRKGSSKNV